VKERLLHFAGSAIAIEYDGAPCERILDILFRHIPANGRAYPHLTYRLVWEETNRELALYRGESLEYHSPSLEAMAAYLMERACYHLADHSQGGLLLHAACLSREGQGFILPGASGSGKSSLAAWLLLQENYHYLTDELAFIPERTLECQGFSRPLNLKPTSQSLFPGLFEAVGEDERLLVSSTRVLTPAECLSPMPVLGATTIDRLVFPRYLDGAGFELRALTKAQAGLALMQCLINARNLPEHGFHEAARLCRVVPAFQITYSDFKQIEEAGTSIFA
jgi:hypothetical protein